MKAASQVALPVRYDGITIDIGYRIDLFVEDEVIVELKAVETVHSIHQAQILSYMKLSRIELGLLINFNVVHLKEGVQRFIL